MALLIKTSVLPCHYQNQARWITMNHLNLQNMEPTFPGLNKTWNCKLQEWLEVMGAMPYWTNYSKCIPIRWYVLQFNLLCHLHWVEWPGWFGTKHALKQWKIIWYLSICAIHKGPRKDSRGESMCYYNITGFLKRFSSILRSAQWSKQFKLQLLSFSKMNDESCLCIHSRGPSFLSCHGRSLLSLYHSCWYCSKI